MCRHVEACHDLLDDTSSPDVGQSPLKFQVLALRLAIFFQKLASNPLRRLCRVLFVQRYSVLDGGGRGQFILVGGSRSLWILVLIARPWVVSAFGRCRRAIDDFKQRLTCRNDVATIRNSAVSTSRLGICEST